VPASAHSLVGKLRSSCEASLFLLGCLVSLGLALAVRTPVQAQDAGDPSAEAQAASFTNLQAVTITGNRQDAMEPFLTRDDKVLFFNNSNAPMVDTNLFWATKVDDLTFQLQGEIGGVNGPALDAVASMDLSNNFYFVSTRSYDTTLSTIYSGNYSKGSVSGTAIVAGVSPTRRGFVDFDQEISADGNTLYFTEGLFTGGSVPASSELLIARRSDSGRFHARRTGQGDSSNHQQCGPAQLRGLHFGG